MESLIFVSGFENTGTRLIPMILEKCGYETFYKKKTNVSYDYLKGFFHTRFFKRYYFNKDNFNYFKKTLNKDIKNVKKCIIKHGPICFMIDDLKKHYPHAKFIHCIRKPEDTLVKESFYYKDYGLYDTWNPSLENKFNFYKKWYTDDIISKNDIIIKMEDIVFDPSNKIKDLLDNLDIDYNDEILQNCINMIKPSKTIGNGNKLLKKQNKKLTDDITVFKNKFSYV
tara:strand:- start:191 stop:868 length:678 start_codon:yes stop_codon:yes gene_type:complete